MVCMLSSPLRAHVGAVPETLGVVLPADSNTGITAIEASYGLLFDAGQGSFEWLCHETIIAAGSPITPRYALNSQGVLLGTTGVLASSRNPEETLYRSVDRCNWEAVTGLSGQVVTDVVFSPTDPQRAIASTATLVTGVSNGLYYSSDAGATWQASDTNSPERLFRNVHFGSDGTAWATASYFNPLRSWLYRSNDNGLSWTEQQISYEAKGAAQVLLDVLLASGDGPQLWLRVDAPISDRLLYSNDGGLSFSDQFEVTSDIKSAAFSSDQRAWLVDGYGRMFQALGSGPFNALAEGPSASGVNADERGLWVSTRVWNEEFALLFSADGENFEGHFQLIDTAPPPSCPSDSHSAQYCEPSWETLQQTLSTMSGDDDDSSGGDDDDSSGGDDDDSSGSEPVGGCCGSTSDGAAQAGLLLPAMLLGWRRRRLSWKSQSSVPARR